MNVLSVLVDQIRNASAPALLFSGGAVLLWLWIFVWGFRTQTHWYRRALVIATLYCFISEYLSIRLGKYHYDLLPLSLPDFEIEFLTRGLHWLADHHVIPEIVQTDFPKHVPPEIALIEAALLVTIFRITNLLFPNIAAEGATMRLRDWMKLALPIACLNGVLSVNLDAILDPVVSGSVFVEVPKQAEDFRGLALWTWHTTAQYPGLWFGIPIANYTAWFAGLFAFSLAVRIGRDHLIVGPTRFARGKNVVLLFLRAIGFLVLVLFIVKFGLDYLVYGQFGPLALSSPPWRQFGVLLAVLGASIYVASGLWRQHRPDNPWEVVTVAPQGFIFLFCLWGLSLAVMSPRRNWLIPLWTIGVMLAALHAWATFRARRAPQPVVSPRVEPAG